MANWTFLILCLCILVINGISTHFNRKAWAELRRRGYPRSVKLLWRDVSALEDEAEKAETAEEREELLRLRKNVIISTIVMLLVNLPILIWILLKVVL